VFIETGYAEATFEDGIGDDGAALEEIPHEGLFPVTEEILLGIVVVIRGDGAYGIDPDPEFGRGHKNLLRASEALIHNEVPGGLERAEALTPAAGVGAGKTLRGGGDLLAHVRSFAVRARMAAEAELGHGDPPQVRHFTALRVPALKMRMIVSLAMLARMIERSQFSPIHLRTSISRSSY
jgi:hypothetical protein